MTAAWVPDPEDEDLGEDATIDEHVEHLLARISRKKASLARYREQRDRWVEKYDEWFRAKSTPLQEDVARMEELVKGHAIQRGIPTLHLPSGTVRVRPARQSLNTVDRDAFREWITGHDEAERLSRWTCEPNKAEVKKYIEQTGEVVPGVELVDGEVSVTISLEVDDE